MKPRSWRDNCQHLEYIVNFVNSVLSTVSNNKNYQSNVLCFSIISTNECCCDIIESNNVYKTFIHLFEQYSSNEEIIVRLTYTLGNIVAKIDNTRVKVSP